MKLLNIIEDSKLKENLFNSLNFSDEYRFMLPATENLIDKIKEFIPDFIVAQDQYDQHNSIEIINIIKNFYSNLKIIILSGSENALTELKKNLDHFDHIYFFPQSNISEGFESIYQQSRSSQKNSSTNCKKILFADDSNSMHEFIEDTLSNQGFSLVHAYNGFEAYQLYRKTQPGLIISDLEMPVMNGHELCKKIKLENKGQYIPVLILSSNQNSVNIDTAFHYGADDYLFKPIDPKQLLETIKDYFISMEKEKITKVLVVDHNKMSLELISHKLQKNQLQTLTATDGKTAYETALNEKPDIVITDLDTPGLNGFQLSRKIKNHPDLKNISIIILGTEKKNIISRNIKKIGVAHYFSKPFDIDKLLLIVDHLILEKYEDYKKEHENMLIVIETLVTALEARDKYTQGHTERVSELSLRLGEYIGLSETELQELKVGANLHDIGKIGVKDSILLKPGRLTDEEFDKIKEHPEIGASILAPVPSLQAVLPYVLFHHERWDGKGYPTGLKGKDIPKGARIIAIADTFDAVTSDRPYRKGMPKEKGLQIIKENCGTQFCPTIGKAFLEMVDKNFYD